MTVTIRKANPADVETIVAFNQGLAMETEDKQLNHDTLTAGVGRILSDESKGQYFVAECDDRVVGQIMYTTEWSDWRNGEVLWLQSVYVHADYRGRGIFGLLLGELQKIVDSNPEVVGLRLYVEKENTTAQGTYLKSGFELPGYLVMERIPKT